jgi:hypothetical protein
VDSVVSAAVVVLAAPVAALGLLQALAARAALLEFQGQAREVVARRMKLEKVMDHKTISVLAGVLALGLVGCGGPADTGDTAAPVAVKKYNYKPTAEAGLDDVKTAADTGQLKKLYLAASVKYGSSRHNPFVLTKDETAYETSQNGARLFQQVNGFSNEYKPEEQVDVVPVLEQQPYRRLAGVVVGDSVLAIIDMGDGREAQIIHPGEKIPDSEWTVVSIDQEKAILKRDGNKLPKEITVPLETARPGTPGYGGNQNGAPGGGPGFGPPGFGGGGNIPGVPPGGNFPGRGGRRGPRGGGGGAGNFGD